MSISAGRNSHDLLFSRVLLQRETSPTSHQRKWKMRYMCGKSARECLSHTLRGAKTFICRQRTRERLSGPLGGRTKQTFDIRHCFNWQGFKHKDSTLGHIFSFFNSLQMLQLMSQTKDTFLMCRNYEQGHKRIRRASVWQLKDPLNF